MEMMRCLYTICVYLWYDHVIILCYVLIYSTWYVYSILWCAVWSMLHTVASIYVYIMCMTCHTYVYVYGIMVCMISWYVCTYLYGMYVHTYVCMCAYYTPGSGVYVLQGLVRRVHHILCKYHSMYVYYVYIMCMLCHTSCVCLWYHGMHDIMVCVYIPMYACVHTIHHVVVLVPI